MDGEVMEEVDFALSCKNSCGPLWVLHRIKPTFFSF